MRQPTKEAVLASPGVHYFCKQIIRDAENHDPVDAIKDVELALAVLEHEYNKVMAPNRTEGMTRLLKEKEIAKLSNQLAELKG